MDFGNYIDDAADIPETEYDDSEANGDSDVDCWSFYDMHQSLNLKTCLQNFPALIIVWEFGSIIGHQYFNDHKLSKVYWDLSKLAPASRRLNV